MNTFFDIPSPSGGWFSDWLPSLHPALDSIKSNTHETVAWETLLKEGITCDALLRCNPRTVAAWVRKNGDECITMADIRAAPGGDALTAETLLTRREPHPS